MQLSMIRLDFARLMTFLLMAFIVLPTGAWAFSMELPLDCSRSTLCVVQNYSDHDSSEKYADYTCGPLSYDKHTGTDFRVSYGDMEQGVPVLAAADGTVRAVRDGEPEGEIFLRGKAGIKGREAGNAVVVTHADGFETQLGVDHLGHWALTGLLLPALLAAPAARVVTVTSFALLMGRRLDPGNPHLSGRYDPWRAYGQAKLANYHFGLGLQDAFARAGVAASSLVAHPGLAHTDLQTTTVRLGGAGGQARLWASLARRIGASAAEAAMPQLRAATDPAAAGGEFYGPRYLLSGPPVRLRIRRPGDTEAIRILWEVSERETGIAVQPSTSV